MNKDNTDSNCPRRLKKVEGICKRCYADIELLEKKEGKTESEKFKMWWKISCKMERLHRVPEWCPYRLEQLMESGK